MHDMQAGRRKLTTTMPPSRLAVVLLVAVSLSLLATPGAHAGDAEPAASLGEALRQGRFSLALRYRYEFVDQDGISEAGYASTLRTTLGYGSRSFHGFSGGFEVEDVTAIGNDESYNNAGAPGLGNGVTDRPIVADPEITEFNQAHLTYEGPRLVRARGGRLKYTLDNHRFVGDVGWRQNTQSFDAAWIEGGRSGPWRLAYAYLDVQHTVTGSSRPMAGHLFHVRYDSRIGQTVAYSYLLDFEDPASYTLSSSTFGARLDGSATLQPVRLAYWMEYARQIDRAGNPQQFGLDYVHAELGTELEAWGLRLGYELLRGDGVAAVQAPLGTNHKFNGFADKFLTTPADGLQDFYVRVSWTRKPWSSFVDYHFFEADEKARSYGDEFDLQAVYASPWKQEFAVKAAVYRAEDFATDTTKLMAWTAWGF